MSELSLDPYEGKDLSQVAHPAASARKEGSFLAQIFGLLMNASRKNLKKII